MATSPSSKNEKRTKLRALSNYKTPTTNSVLKKKFTLLAKLKNLNVITASQIKKDFENENMEKFKSEICDNIFCEENFKKGANNEFRIIELYNYFNHVYNSSNTNFHDIFIKKMMDEIKSSIMNCGSPKTNLYGLLIFFMELVIVKKIMDVKKAMKILGKIFAKIDSSIYLKYLEHLSDIYHQNCLDKMAETNIEIVNEEKDLLNKEELEEIKGFVCSFLTEEILENNYDTVKSILLKLKEDSDIEEKKKFKKIIEADFGEFNFYEEINEITDTRKKIKNPLFFLTENIRNKSKIEENIQLIIKGFREEIKDEKLFFHTILNLADSDKENIPILSKILIHLKEPLNKFIKKIEESKSKSIFLIFLCEFSKFGKYHKKKVVKKLDDAMKDKKTQNILLALDSIARFYLCCDDGNYIIRKFLEKLKNYKIDCSNVLRNEINNCLSRILNKKVEIVSFDDFYSFYLSKSFENSKNKNNILTKDIVLILMLKPWIFETYKFLIQTINDYKILDFAIKITYENIIITAVEQIKCNCLSYTRFYSSLLNEKCEIDVKKSRNNKNYKDVSQDKIKINSNTNHYSYIQNIENFFSSISDLSINVTFKAYIMINFLTGISNNEIRKLYLELVRKMVCMCDDPDLEISFCNFLMEFELNDPVFDIDHEMSLLSI